MWEQNFDMNLRCKLEQHCADKLTCPISLCVHPYNGSQKHCLILEILLHEPPKEGLVLQETCSEWFEMTRCIVIEASRVKLPM
jgi:hypothetical protein